MLQKRVQELDELINGEKEILMKKNVPVEQMLKYLGYEKLTREMLEEYVQGSENGCVLILKKVYGVALVGTGGPAPCRWALPDR